MEERVLSSSATRRWPIHAGLGVMLIILLAIHLIVNHWVAPQGLLRHADVIRYYDIPGIAWMELIFLVVVTIHCLLGLHSILLDLNLQPGLTRIVTRILIVTGLAAILYGAWLSRVVVLLSVS